MHFSTLANTFRLLDLKVKGSRLTLSVPLFCSQEHDLCLVEGAIDVLKFFCYNFLNFN